MPALYDSKGESFPSNALVDHLFLRQSTGDRFVKTASGNWILFDNVYAPFGGALPSSGGVVTGPITGAHDLATAKAANIQESLRVDDIDVVTMAMLKPWEDRIFAQLNAAKNASKGASLLDPAESITESFVSNAGLLAVKHGKSYDFGDIGGVLGDVRPRFADQSRPDWSCCSFYAALVALADPKAAGDVAPTGDAFIPARFVNGLNLGYPTGFGFSYDSFSPPKITVMALHHSMENWCCIAYRVLGWR